MKRTDSYTTIDLFAGIGGIRLGFEACGCQNLFSCEWDKYAAAMYKANFGERPFGDINDGYRDFLTALRLIFPTAKLGVLLAIRCAYPWWPQSLGRWFGA